MRTYITIIAFMLAAAVAAAQSTPLYKCDTFPPSSRLYGGGAMLAYYQLGGYQVLYHRSDFPNMPAQGVITDLYIRNAWMTPKGAYLPGLMVRMGSSHYSMFPVPIVPGAMVHPQLDTVYYDSLFVLPDTIWKDSWLRLPLQKPYAYSFGNPGGDSVLSLVVEITHDSLEYIDPNQSYSKWFFTYNIDNQHDPFSLSQRVLPLNNRKGALLNAPLQLGLLVIGFNPKPDPVGVAPLPAPASGGQLYPNPANDWLHLTTSAPAPYHYTIMDMTGRVMLQGSTPSKAIDIRSLSSGTYLLQCGNETHRFVK